MRSADAFRVMMSAASSPAARETAPPDHDDVTRLESMTTWPYPVEPPRKSLMVNAAIALAALRRRPPRATPHLHGGDDVEKLEYELRTGSYYWDMLEPVIGIDALNAKDVLDVGCGYGGKSVYMAENTDLRSITGFDLPEIFDPEVANRYASERGLNCSFTTGYAERMPFEDETFEVVVMDDVLEHVQDPDETIRECYRVLRSGGLFIVKFPSIKMPMSHHFDRALQYPGMHWIRSMKVWAGGFNHYRLYGRRPVRYQPFAKVVATPYHTGVTSNLNGLDLAAFTEIVDRSGFKVRTLELLPPMKARKVSPLIRRPYESLRSIPFLRERLSDSIAFVGEK